MEHQGIVRRAHLLEVVSELWPRQGPKDVEAEFVPAYAMSMQTGLDADSYFLDHRGKSYFIKLHHDELPTAPDHALSARAAQLAAGAGLSPNVIAYLPALAAIVFERAPADWRTAMRPDFDDAEVRQEVIATLRRWHGVGSLSSSRPVWDFIDTTLSALDAFAASGLPGSHIAAPEDYQQLRAAYSALVEQISTPPEAHVSLHGEVLASNLLLGPAKQVMLVDFDRATRGDPLWDVAGVALALDTPDTEHADLLRLFSSSCTDDAVARLRANMAVQDIGWGLWGRLAHFLSPRDSIEFFKYGETRLARARGRLARDGLRGRVQA